jgi:hypothetical protein
MNLSPSATRIASVSLAAPPTHTQSLCHCTAISLHQPFEFTFFFSQSLQVLPSTEELESCHTPRPLDRTYHPLSHRTMSKRVKDTTLYDVLGVTPEATDIEWVLTVPCPESRLQARCCFCSVGSSWLITAQVEESVPKESNPGELSLSRYLTRSPGSPGSTTPTRTPHPRPRRCSRRSGELARILARRCLQNLLRLGPTRRG